MEAVPRRVREGTAAARQVREDREVSAARHARPMLPRPFDQGVNATRDDAVRAGATVIGDAVRELRLEVGLSQRQLAWRVGFAQSTISRLETGSLRGLRFMNLALIVGALRLDPRIALRPIFEADGEPPAPRRRLPGQRRRNRLLSLGRRSNNASYYLEGHRLGR